MLRPAKPAEIASCFPSDTYLFVEKGRHDQRDKPSTSSVTPRDSRSEEERMLEEEEKEKGEEIKRVNDSYMSKSGPLRVLVFQDI